MEVGGSTQLKKNTHFQFLVDFLTVAVQHSQVQWSKVGIETAVEKGVKKLSEHRHVYKKITKL